MTETTSTTASRKKVQASLDAQRTAELDLLKKKFGGGDTAAISYAISHTVMALRKEHPGDFPLDR